MLRCNLSKCEIYQVNNRRINHIVEYFAVGELSSLLTYIFISLYLLQNNKIIKKNNKKDIIH